ncbi:hypothetical protein [Kordia sp.]|uniref:hypothetical protein n=1 Tax=Kordia sp. TaxID=1965332 RepID=UPI0025C20A6F|nr:hypothetical protein [Kordia sp.]MCH2195438.1 hypothetical protein [Kordia sp.]
MEILYYLATLCLLIFMILATYDGFYLHIYKYELYGREDSKFEHKIHTIRAFLFPLIVWLLFVNNDAISFWCAITFVCIDSLVLAIDAYAESDSRKSIGGLPKWEYILHIFANSFHFASEVLIIATKIQVSEFGVLIHEVSTTTSAQEFFRMVSVNMIPGAIVLAFVHLILMSPKGIRIWDTNIKKVKQLFLK